MKYDTDEDIISCLKIWGCENIKKISNIAFGFTYAGRYFQYVMRSLHEANKNMNQAEREIWYGKSN